MSIKYFDLRLMTFFFRIEEALEGFLAFHKVQISQKENKKDDNDESKIGIKSQVHILRAVEEMALRAVSILRIPKITKRLFVIIFAFTIYI